MIGPDAPDIPAAVSDAPSRRERRRPDPARFRAAARHSAVVRFLRLAIPAVIVVVLGSLMFVAFFNPFRAVARLQIDPGKIVISGTRVTMGSPRYAGFTRDERPYEVTARSASQDLTKPDIVDLNEISAKVDLQDHAIVEMTAATGRYDSKRDLLMLSNQILIRSSTGYSGRLQEALVDVKKGSVVSEKPVEVYLLNGTLNANRLEIEEHGDVIRFGRGVVMDLASLAPDKPADRQAVRR
jgi:lipopolysaccharide export system protein LptC